MKIKSKKSIIIFSALALALISVSAYAYIRNSDNNETQPSPVSTGKDQINYGPPTDEEKKAGDRVKQELDNQKETDNTGFKSVKPEITYSGVYKGNVEVSSNVPGVFENSGKCTLTLTKDAKVVSQSKTAVPNVSEMSCGLIKIPVSKLSPGTWTATVTYSSAKAKGTSNEVSIDIK